VGCTGEHGPSGWQPGADLHSATPLQEQSGSRAAAEVDAAHETTRPHLQSAEPAQHLDGSQTVAVGVAVAARCVAGAAAGFACGQQKAAAAAAAAAASHACGQLQDCACRRGCHVLHSQLLGWGQHC